MSARSNDPPYTDFPSICVMGTTAKALQLIRLDERPAATYISSGMETDILTAPRGRPREFCVDTALAAALRTGQGGRRRSGPRRSGGPRPLPDGRRPGPVHPGRQRRLAGRPGAHRRYHPGTLAGPLGLPSGVEVFLYRKVWNDLDAVQ